MLFDVTHRSAHCIVRSLTCSWMRARALSLFLSFPYLSHSLYVSLLSLSLSLSLLFSLACSLSLAMGWLRLLNSLKLQVYFAKEPYKRDYILQKRHLISRSLLILGTPQ